MRLGGTANFYCLALSYGSLVYNWEKNSGRLPSTATKSCVTRYFIGKNTTFSNLVISNIQLSHEGKYCCAAQNEYGSNTKCAWLNVDSK